MLLDEVFACFHFHWIKGVDFGNFGNEVRVKFNGVVIGMMGGKLIMGFFREDIRLILLSAKLLTYATYWRSFSRHPGLAIIGDIIGECIQREENLVISGWRQCLISSLSWDSICATMAFLR